MKTDRILYTIIAAALLAVSGHVTAAQPAAFKNVAFAEAPTFDGGSKTLRINIWPGVGDGPRPAVLFVHGGAWQFGSNDLEAESSEQIRALMALRESGVTVAAAQAIKMYQALYDAGVEAELLLNDRAPHGDLGPEAAAAIRTFILRVLLP